MSVREIIQHSLEKNPLAMKQALEAEMQERIRVALETKMTEAKEEDKDEDESEDDEDESEDDDDDDDDDDDEEMMEAASPHDKVFASIDHMDPSRDSHAKDHNISFHKTDKDRKNPSGQSVTASGTRKNMQKYLAKHYGDHNDAKEFHPHVYK